MARIFVDTNVLFPFSVMDVLLALSEDAIHEVIWTDALLDEWQDVIVREQRRSPATAASVVAAIREFFADSRVDTGDYEHLVAEMSGDDPDDKQHMAAAIAGGATVLLTRNVRDFPAAPLAAHGLRVTDPDAYLCDLIDELPDEVAGTVIRLTAEKSRPPRTRADMLTHLRAAGVPRFAAILATMLEPGDA